MHPDEAGGGGDSQTSAVDVHVGGRMRLLRQARGTTQAQLAEAIAVSFQQVQKYEQGANRISASKLYAAAKFLQAKVGDFYEGLPAPGDGDAGTVLDPIVAQAMMQDPALARSLLSLLQMRARSRRIVMEMIEVLSGAT